MGSQQSEGGGKGEGEEQQEEEEEEKMREEWAEEVNEYERKSE